MNKNASKDLKKGHYINQRRHRIEEVRNDKRKNHVINLVDAKGKLTHSIIIIEKNSTTYPHHINAKLKSPSTHREKNLVSKTNNFRVKKYAKAYKSIYDSEENDLNDAIAMLKEMNNK